MVSISLPKNSTFSKGNYFKSENPKKLKKLMFIVGIQIKNQTLLLIRLKST